MKVLGLLALSRDPAACLVIDGQVAAVAEEERFIRVKHANGQFPVNAVKFCLRHAGLALRDVDAIAVGWDATKYPGRMAEVYLENWYKYRISDEGTLKWHIKNLREFEPQAYGGRLRRHFTACGVDEAEVPPIRFVPHHYSHAVSAFYCSGFDEAGVITMDGHGEEHCTVLWEVRDGSFKKVREFTIPLSLGWFYAAFTKWVGFEIYDGEGKLMGLAPYGRPQPAIREKMDRLCWVTDEGYDIDPSYFFYSKRTQSSEYSDRFVELFGPGRAPGEPLTQYHKDVAYEAQEKLEEVGLKLASELVKATGLKKLCLAGGVALNCKMNGRIWRSLDLDQIFIQPMSADEGAALGAAMAVSLDAGAPPARFFMEHVYLGPEFSNEEIEQALRESGLPFERHDDVEAVAAKHLAAGDIVGWFQGRMEVGPRALGARSILVDPRRSEMKEKVNNKVKFREPWRPFCPSVLDEVKGEYFEKACYHPFMILTFSVLPERQHEIPAVVHVDGTARPQTVRKEVNPRFWTLLHEFKARTGVGVLLNTSFNIKGEPIVCTPFDAIECFLGTDIDTLVIGNYVTTK